MAVTRHAAICLLALAWPLTASAQAVTTETDVTVGRSSDGTTGAAAQARVFGASRSDWRFFFETSWGLVDGGKYSDAFSSAYPYDRRLRPMEMYLEKTNHSASGRVFGVRTGRYRTPFGISGRSDHAYLGFLRAPMIRYPWNWALSSTYMDLGANVLVGRPAFSIETSIGTPADEGEAPRRRGVTAAVRSQAYVKSVILGASYINSAVADTDPHVSGRLALAGIDGRWMFGGIQVRGEWVIGRADSESTTRGGYLDVIGHHRTMGPVTLVARLEHLDWDYPPEPELAVYPRRLTVGARVRVARDLHVQIGALRNFCRTPRDGDVFTFAAPSTTFDAAITWSRRF